MTTLQPDQASALGLSTPRTRRHEDPDTHDGTLISDPAVRAPLVLEYDNFHDVTETICGWNEQKTPRWWLIAFGISSSVAGIGTLMIIYLFITGVGVWGL